MLTSFSSGSDTLFSAALPTIVVLLSTWFLATEATFLYLFTVTVSSRSEIASGRKCFTCLNTARSFSLLSFANLYVEISKRISTTIIGSNSNEATTLSSRSDVLLLSTLLELVVFSLATLFTLKSLAVFLNPPSVTFLCRSEVASC